jgi:hypothetical protein
MNIQSHVEVEQSFVQIVEVRDSKDVTAYLAWSSGVLQPYDNTTIGVSWIPSVADDYQIRTFIIDGFEDPEVLTTLTSTRFEVLDLDHTVVTFIDRAPKTTFEPSDFTLEEAQHILKEIFSDPDRKCRLYSFTPESNSESYQYLMPENVNFEYIEPLASIFRIDCAQGSVESYVYFSQVNGSLVPAERMITINAPEQAVEYLHFFHLRSSMLYSEQDYFEGLQDSTLIEHSPIRRLHVIDNGDSFTVKLNILNVYNSSLTYERWNIKPNADREGYHEWFPEYSISVAKLHYAA